MVNKAIVDISFSHHLFCQKLYNSFPFDKFDDMLRCFIVVRIVFEQVVDTEKVVFIISKEACNDTINHRSKFFNHISH